MFDFDDAGDTILEALFFAPGTWAGLIFVAVIGIGAYWLATANAKECAEMHCSNWQTPKLMKHECL